MWTCGRAAAAGLTHSVHAPCPHKEARAKSVPTCLWKQSGHMELEPPSWCVQDRPMPGGTSQPQTSLCHVSSTVTGLQSAGSPQRCVQVGWRRPCPVLGLSHTFLSWLDVMSHDLRVAAGLHGVWAQPSGCHNVPSVSAALPGQSCGRVVRAPRGPDSAWSPCLATSGRVSVDTVHTLHTLMGSSGRAPGWPHPAHQERRRKSC